MIRYLYLALETTALVVHVFALLAIALIVASLVVPGGGGSLLGAAVLVALLLAVDYGIARPVGRRATRALARCPRRSVATTGPSGKGSAPAGRYHQTGARPSPAKALGGPR